AGSLLADHGTCLPPRLLCHRQRSGAQPASKATSPDPTRRALSRVQTSLCAFVEGYPIRDSQCLFISWKPKAYFFNHFRRKYHNYQLSIVNCQFAQKRVKQKFDKMKEEY
ncbi:MAG: hypothetical protein IKK41_06720, partial [Oscillospiraceae bacterium]|nr:hypothetical protein [Oscillospiraceae bacterium]